MRRFRRFLPWLLLLALLPAGAREVQPGMAERGRALYEEHCLRCHGPDGRGDTPAGRLLRPAPGDLADPVDAYRRTWDESYSAIKNGRPGSAMSGWNGVLAETQVGDVIEYVRSLSAGGAEAQSPDRLSLEMGRRIFARECAGCHGTDGGARTEVAGRLKIPPTDFTDPVVMARLDDARMHVAIYRGRPGTAMGGQGQLLSRGEVIDVMRYVRTLASPWPAGTTREQIDLKVGAYLYARHCTACHGEKGDGRTEVGRHLSSTPFDLATMGEGGTGDEEIARSILRGKPGTAMGPWDGVLSREDVRRLLAYIHERFARR